ncbi:MAG: 2-oxoacid:acceptor oxidoreductase family protein [Candidatus Bipolaricaulota bacterium]|nr:2-oxoacid:acceptor oxidoreductase family protein [Candidatus Bipolaricaulota bacterium]MDW8126723.1 2-oxoacid:acceptor oxidoreductase family protein [Candidatus Bipolaricaulota bacterium]
METGIVFAGFGGQGILLAGKVLARAAMEEGFEVTWLPSYGPEMRGGTANCTVVIADEPVGSPIVDTPWILVAMNGPSLERFSPRVAKGGLIIVNASLVSQKVERADVRILLIPLNDIAQELGEPRCANMVALGATVRGLGLFSLDPVLVAMEEELGTRGREKLVEVNRQALLRGYSFLNALR